MSKWPPLLMLPVIMGALCFAPCLPHDAHLFGLERRYRAVVHPPDSRSLGRESELGLLEGNGNHCDYFVGELRVARMTRSQLEAFYGTSVELEVLEPPAAPNFVSSPRDRLQDAATRVRPAAGEVLYMVSLYDQEHAGLDLRCH